MELIALEADIRNNIGKGPARVLRRSGRMPAVLYGPKSAPLGLSVDVKELEQAIKKSRGAQVFLTLTVSGETGASHRVMIKELQRDAVSKDPLHADFYEVPMDKKLKVMAPVATTGKAKGVEAGGVLQLVRRELEIFCLPDQIPEIIELDVTDLEIGDSIHVGEILLQEGVEIIADTDFTVVTVSAPTREAIEEEEEEAEEAEVGVEAESGSEETAE